MKNILISLAALLFALGCKKEHILYLSDDIKKNYSYKPGSYWIYRDSATGREDSCYVYSNSIPFVDFNHQYGGATFDYDKEEYIKVKMKLATMFKVNKGNIDIDFSIYNSGIVGLLRDISNPKTFSGPLPINQQRFDKYNYRGASEFLPSIILQGKEFLNTSKINDDSCIYYFNDNIGLIKMKLSSDSVVYIWEIVRYKIIK